jgi:ATP-dependent RNA helicase RhlE
MTLARLPVLVQNGPKSQCKMPTSKPPAFSQLGLNQHILGTLKSLGYDTPSPIQAKAIPEILAGRDVMAAAQTGTGKTAGFTLPILTRLCDNYKAPKGNHAKVLVLTPTRELAAQVADSVKQYGAKLPIKSAVVFGGVGINPQMKKLRGGVDVLIATPGRLLDLHSQNAVKFDQLEVLVLDEADRMLDMGFIHDIKRIIKLLPRKRQNLLFSATFSSEIQSLAGSIVNDPVKISVSPPNSTVELVEQSLIAVEKSDKRMVLSRLISENDWFQVLVFSRTKHGANRLAQKLVKSNIEAAAIHGDKSQGARTRALAEFKAGKIRVLVATDIAARGIDIDQLPQVVNFDLPQVAEDYVHRIGRTGRAGASGRAVSLVSHDEHSQLVAIEKLIKQTIPRVTLDGYDPLNTLPPSDQKVGGGGKPRQTKNKTTNQRSNSQPGKGKKKGSKKPSRPGKNARRRQHSPGNKRDGGNA